MTRRGGEEDVVRMRRKRKREGNRGHGRGCESEKSGNMK
jgi:hypothetical protein